jgi:hypothetical protein
MRWNPRKEVPFALAVMAMTVLNAQASVSGDWGDDKSPEEMAKMVGVKIRLREVCDDQTVGKTFGRGGRNGRLVIVSQEPATVSSTIIERCDGTIDILDGNTMRDEYNHSSGHVSTGYSYRPWLYNYYDNTLYSYRTGRISSYNVSPARFANHASFAQSKTVANHVSSALSGGRAHAVAGGRSGFFSGGGRGGA